ncbi:MAG: hypothetical protein GX051_00145 [Clostridiales bacterium]|nr:hypothetical protein [Clostridiales bacterium]
MDKPVLRFNKNGHFRVLMFSDFHAGADCSPKVTRGIEALIENTNPDFVMIGGDQCLGRDTREGLREYMSSIIEPVLIRNLPWAAVFGNHDREKKGSIDIEQEQAIYESIPGCLMQRGPTDIHGVGNYCLQVLSRENDEAAFNLWAMDSHREIWDFFKKYSSDQKPDGVYPEHFNDGENGSTPYFNQVMWYYTESIKKEAAAGRKIPGIMFMHTPLLEYMEIVRNPEQCYAIGSKRAAVDCSEISSGLFMAAVERGDIKGFFFGHEHLTDLQGVYGGITMACDAAIGYNMSGHDDLRGGRVIDLYEDGRMQTRAVKLIDIMGIEAMRNPDYFEGGCSYFIRKL